MGVCMVGTERVSGYMYGRNRKSAWVYISCLLTLPLEEAPANSVPAAAVIRRVQALIGITGRKAFVGGCLS